MIISDSADSIGLMKAFFDNSSRKILISTMSKSLSIHEIADETQVPVSTCYRRIHDLEDFGLMRRDQTIMTDDGKKYVRYISIVKNARIHFDSGKLSVDVGLNGNPGLDSLILVPETIRATHSVPS